MKVGKCDFFIDLLFYNVKLHCYFVVELKNYMCSTRLTMDNTRRYAGVGNVANNTIV
ncbi:MAG: DUF1016 domain-containing protein [Lachnospiraceae bacterium]|nr:DUF1016 domain-containing protein [Lachnospiraceae bacterium]MDY5578276.1 PDDEXK nuclease domain-containing protein [Lachnospiraceae bacterium]